MAASTAVIAGTAGAVQHRQQQRYAEKDAAAMQEAFEAAPPPPPPAAPPPAAPDMATELQQLAQLHQQGILTDEEFAAKKAQILGI